MAKINHSLVSNDRTLSKVELIRQGSCAASGLLDAGIKAGDAVALILRNDFPYFVMHEAARYGPFDMVPVNWHLNAAEIKYILEDCKARAVVIHEDLLQQDLEASVGDLLLIVVPTPVEIRQAYAGKSAEASSTKNYESWQQWITKHSACEEPPLPFYRPLFYRS